MKKNIFLDFFYWNISVLNYLFFRQFKLMLALDGSGKGAGLAAAIAVRLRTRVGKS